VKHWSGLAVAGLIIAAAGAVALVWLQVDGPFPDELGSSYRWQAAMAPLFVIASGLIVFTAAQILRTLVGRAPEAAESTRELADGLTVRTKREPYSEAMRRSTRSSRALNGSLQSTVRWAWSLSFRCTQSTV
jgi:hypothetical protein